MKSKSNIFGVILAGGSGSRLWPLSREMYPKQLLRLTNEYTLFQSTFLRLSKIIPDENIITVTNIKHSDDIKIQLNELNKISGNPDKQKNYHVIVEPVGRNTAPAIGLSVAYIRELMSSKNADPVIVVAPSDHMVQCQDRFIEALNSGIKLAEHGFIVTFGIKPEKPDTGYGYIHTFADKNISQIVNSGLKVKEFKEKPDLQTAENYLKLRTYYWNSGIFMFKASTMLNELERYAPDIFENLNKSRISDTTPTVKFDDYIKMPDISIDYAVMEHSSCIALIPVDCGWNDMGSWEAIYDTSDRDKNNNFISGNVIDIDSQDSLIYGTSKLVTTIGLKNTVIIETEDAILACDKNRTQDVKKIFELLKKNDDLACKVHQTVYRPWGYYTVLQKEKGYQVKVISVNSGAKLSLQMHNHRSEHWVVLSGTAKVVKGEETIQLHAGDSIDIPCKMKHSLANPGEESLKIIEVQKGDYLEEDDIIRFEDIYGRVIK